MRGSPCLFTFSFTSLDNEAEGVAGAVEVRLRSLRATPGPISLLGEGGAVPGPEVRLRLDEE